MRSPDTLALLDRLFGLTATDSQRNHVLQTCLNLAAQAAIQIGDPELAAVLDQLHACHDAANAGFGGTDAEADKLSAAADDLQTLVEELATSYRRSAAVMAASWNPHDCTDAEERAA